MESKNRLLPENLVRPISNLKEPRGRLRWKRVLPILGVVALVLAATGCSIIRNNATDKISAAIATPSRVMSFEDDGRFPQCVDVRFPDQSILHKDPLTAPAPYRGVNPQLRYATETLAMNRIYDLVDRQLLPQGTKFRLSATAQARNYCLPDLVAGGSRFFIKISEGSGLNLPSGSAEDGLIEVTLPEGVNPVVLTRYAERFPGSGKEKQEWLFFNVRSDQEITFQNSNGSARATGKGPLAVQSVTGGGTRLIYYSIPDRGFADDKPIPAQ